MAMHNANANANGQWPMWQLIASDSRPVFSEISI